MNKSEELRALIRTFVQATGTLAEYLVEKASDEELHAICDDYPIGLSSFDEFNSDAIQWEESVISQQTIIIDTMKNKFEFIAYNTPLDVQGFMKGEEKQLQQKEANELREYQANKKELLPIVLAYLHYLFEYKKQAYQDFRGNDLQLFLECYTNDMYFSEKGSTYKCASINVDCQPNGVHIWLHKHGKYAHKLNMNYTMLGINSTYAEDVEDYMRELIKKDVIYRA